MARITDLIPTVRTHLSSAGDPTVRLYLREAVKQFCQDSLVWNIPIGEAEVEANGDAKQRHQLYDGTNVKGAWAAGTWNAGDIVTSAGRFYRADQQRTAANTDPPADDSAWTEIFYVAPAESFINKVERLELTQDGSVDEERIDGRQFSFDVQTRILTIARGAITAAGSLEVYAVLEPTRNAANIPDFLVELWGNGIADYAIFQMLLMPKQDWSDPQLAEVYRDKYTRRVSEAQIWRARQGTTESIEVFPIEFV